MRARHLLKTYEGRTVLDRVTLDVPQGAVLGLIGRNGAGKSTLLRCLLGLIEPGGGEAFVFGKPALIATGVMTLRARNGSHLDIQSVLLLDMFWLVLSAVMCLLTRHAYRRFVARPHPFLAK